MSEDIDICLEVGLGLYYAGRIARKDRLAPFGRESKRERKENKKRTYRENTMIFNE
jgi:hypothetical protein